MNRAISVGACLALVENKKNLEGLKVGDKIEITFTEALMITVEPGKN